MTRVEKKDAWRGEVILVADLQSLSLSVSSLSLPQAI